MGVLTAICAVTLMSISITAAVPYTSTTPKFRLDPTPVSRGNFKACMRDGIEGLCVEESFCNDEHELVRTGVIDESELRSLECVPEVEWCCSEKNVTKVIPPAPRDVEGRCIVSNRPDCPWCVLLYRGNRLDSDFFCMGTMIGSKVILTTGTCLLQVKKQDVWARVPNSANPERNYTVKYKIVHPKYNSGTRAYDLALFSIENEVEWGPGGPNGACIGINSPLVGDCLAAGIDDDDNIEMAPVFVRKGTCGSGSDVDASCGKLEGEYCPIVPGSPIMCRVNGGPFMVVGQAKLQCLGVPQQALLGNLNVAAGWLQDHLKGTMSLHERNYLYNAV